MNFPRKIFAAFLAVVLCAGSLSAGKLPVRSREAPARTIEVAPVVDVAPIASSFPPIAFLRATNRSKPATHRPSARRLWMEVTAYCPCKKCCGPNAIGLTASGKHVSYNAGKFVAADTDRLPFGTKVIVPGYGEATSPVEVIDRGGAIKGNKLDVFFPSHQEALEWGRRQIAVYVVDDN